MEQTYQKVRQVRPHPFVNNAELRVKSLHIIADIRLQCVKVHAILIQRVKYLFLKRKARRCRFTRRLLVVLLQAGADLGDKVRGDVSNGFHGRGLKVLKSSVIEYLSNGSLQGSPIDPRRHEGTFLRYNHRSDIVLDERFWFILLELVLVSLLQG